MNKLTVTLLFGSLILTPLTAAQPPDGPPPGGPPPFGPGGPGGFGGPPGMMGQERKIVKQFDKNNDNWLNKEERAAAREFLKNERANGGGGRGFGGPRGFGFGRGNQEPPKPGAKINPADVKSFPDSGLYEPTVLRTLFLEFENDDWEMELQDFHGTDVEVPATLTVDGKRYPNVGVHFRGMSSYMGVPAGYRRSLNLTVDLADKKQRVHGYKTLNLLNGHDDPSFLNPILYSHIARQYMPAPKANVVTVAINGENWGVYANVQQFNKEFTAENFKTTKGARWKVRGNPGGDGGLRYFGDNVEEYQRRFTIKSGDDKKAWKALINLCKVLNETPPDKLEAALAPIMDIDSLLWFLALDVSLINCDGYWIRSSDYSIFLDEKGKFHILPSDMNEAFRPAGGPGFGGPGGGFMMRFPPPGEVLPNFLQDMLQLTDAQRKEVTELQKDAAAKLDKILTDEQRKQMKDTRDRGPGGFGAPPGGGPPGGPGGGPPGGFPGGPGGAPGSAGRNAVELDPLVGLDNARMPLRSKVLAVPALRTRYLQHVKTIAEEALDWKNLGPVVAQYRGLIEKEVEADTRKLDSFADFKKMTADGGEPAGEAGPRRGPPTMNLRAFADQRRAYLLNHAEIKKLPATSKATNAAAKDGGP